MVKPRFAAPNLVALFYLVDATPQNALWYRSVSDGRSAAQTCPIPLERGAWFPGPAPSAVVQSPVSRDDVTM